MDKKIAIMGAGNMGGAVVRGLLSAGRNPSAIMVTNRSSQKLIDMKELYHIETSENNLDAARWSDIVVVAVKPPVLQAVCKQIAEALTANHVVISLAAGVDIETIRCWLNKVPRVVRAMPNTPCAIQKGVIGLYAKQLDAASCDVVNDVFKTMGETYWLEKEEDINLLTALCGSGPAYVFLFTEMLVKVAKGLGLEGKMADAMLKRMVYGAAELALESPLSISALREQVTSPNGTTFAALNVLVEAGLEQHLGQAVKAAVTRAEEIQLEIKSENEVK